MNTGVQRSSATPPAARTATTPAVGREPGNVVRHRQERAADRDGARHSLRRDRERRQPARPRAQGHPGDGDPRRALHPHPRALPAGLGLGAGGHDQARAARRRDAGCSRCSRPSTARSPARTKIRQPACRSTEYLQAAEALRPPVRQASPTTRAHRADPGDRRPQHRTIRPARRLGDAPWTSRSPSPSTSARASPTRPALAHQPARLRRPAAAVQPRLPRRREHPGLAVPRRRRRLRGRLAGADRGQSAARRSWAASATTPARARATAASSTRRSASTRSSASSATRRCKRGWKFAPPARRIRQARAGRRRRARRACPPPITCAGSATR